MTVTSLVRKMEYAGSDITGPYPYTFQVFLLAHMTVTVIDADGTEHAQVPGVDFNASGIGELTGGAVTMVLPVATGKTLVIERTVPLYQEATNLLNQGPYYPDTIEAALDYGVMIDQQLADAYFRLNTIVLPALEGNITIIEGDIVIIEGDIGDINEQIGAINIAIGAINTRLDNIEARLDAIEARLDIIEAQIADILAELEALWAAIALLLTNPMTHAGDMIVGGVAGAPARLPYRPTEEGPKFLITRNEQPEWVQFVIFDYASAGTPGDLIYAAPITGAWTSLPIGNELDVLTVVDGVPSWEPPA